ncbi:MAG: hypothetical protein H7838_04160 [Magnetococcus sp. DMHC-8]
MATPNIRSLTTVTPGSDAKLLTASNQDIVTNAAASGTFVRIVSMYAANIHASANQTITLTCNKNGSDFVLGNALTIPVNCILNIIDKVGPLHLMENDKIKALAGATNAVNLITSWEVMS